MKNKEKFPRLKPKYYKDIAYVTGDDIKKFHSKEWVKKYTKAAGYGNTGIIVTENGKQVFGIYWSDYQRFANVVDYGTPTYWD